MFARISYTWQIMGASWDVLKRDTRLLVFPLLSGISCIVVMASFFVPAFLSGALDEQALENQTRQQQILWYAGIFLFYVCNYFVITFFNTAIIACAISRMAGGEPTLIGGFSEAFKRIHLILGWALVAATVGMIIRVIEERSQWIGKIVAAIIGGVWTLLTFLVVPVIVVEQKGPFQALKESARLFGKTWGEQIVANFSFGIIFFLLAIPAWIGIGFGAYSFATDSTTVAFISIGLSVLYLIVLALIQSALQSIFQAAVYMYTQGVAGGPGFPVVLLKDAMAQK
jgi:hypothetical protein